MTCKIYDLTFPAKTFQKLKRHIKLCFIKVGKGLHYIIEDSAVLEKATGEYHKEASWLVDVKRA